MRMRNHFEKMRAMREADSRSRNAAAGDAAADPADGLAHDLAGPQAKQMAALMRAELARLHQIKSTEAKVEAKKTMLAQFIPHVEGVLEADAGGTDDVVTTIMVWALDVGDYPLMFRILAYVLRHRLALPERYKRDAASFVIEELADRILGLLKAKADLDSGMVFALDNVLTEAKNLDMHDQTRAKANRALGKVVLENPDLGPGLGGPVRAVELLKEALRLDPKCGATGELKAAEKAVVKLEPEPAEPAEQAGEQPA